MTKYRHLFFDLDNTLYDFEANSYLALETVFQQLKIVENLPSFEEYFKVYSRINDNLWALYREKKMAKDVLRGKRHKNSLAEFNIEPPIAPLEIDNRYLKNMTTQTELFPGAIELLNALRKKGYNMHIITNGFKEVQNDKLINTGLKEYFTDIYISEEIKSPKPSREIFEHAIKSSNARKAESIMIGDSWESDIVGAKNFGIDQVYFKLNDLPVDEANYGKATHTITELNQLRTIL
ncbi:MAG: YjjG family noncanonical pyrimidine nucleotidase [Prolixibacteraceae bacterium]|jgi:putative hydrolase of the HAD superfamily|nr:YjjG family noncanonical pyrimidine nucleotidase [Prolixibacteraceae bacterium]